jgi:peroxiredoxin
VVNFWATWCPPCIEETPSLRRFSEILRDEGVIVVGVSVDEDPEVLRKFVAQYELSFPIARDPNRTVAARYGTFKFPETYIIDRSGRIAEKIVNAVDWEDARIVEFVRGLARAGAR